jgi:hypothetical protein
MLLVTLTLTLLFFAVVAVVVGTKKNGMLH